MHHMHPLVTSRPGGNDARSPGKSVTASPPWLNQLCKRAVPGLLMAPRVASGVTVADPDKIKTSDTPGRFCSPFSPLAVEAPSRGRRRSPCEGRVASASLSLSLSLSHLLSLSLALSLLCFAPGLRCGQAPHPALQAHPLQHVVGWGVCTWFVGVKTRMGCCMQG